MTTATASEDRAISRLALLTASPLTATTSVLVVSIDFPAGPTRPELSPRSPETGRARASPPSPLRRAPGEVGTLALSQSYDTWSTDPAAAPPDSARAAALRFAVRIARIPSAVAVSGAREGEVNIVWTFVRKRDPAVRRRIYGEEIRLMGEFPELTFDFNVVSLDQTPTRFLLPEDLQGSILFYREQTREEPE